MKPKLLGVIPARAGSKRLPGKNKKLLNGKPLFEYAIAAALASELVACWVLSTDDEDILQIGAGYPELHTLRRPAELADDRSKAITYVEHALQAMKESFDGIVIVQPTSPFTKTADIDGTIALMWEQQAGSAASIMQVDHAIHPVKLKTMRGPWLEPYLEEEAGRMAAHELPELWVRNGAVYVSTMGSIKRGEIVTSDCVGYPMPRERSLDINDPLDFAFAEFLMMKYGTR